MKMSRTWLAAWSIAELLSAVLAMLIITPTLLHRLDANNFSAWVIAQSVLLAAPLLSIGTGTAMLSAAANAPDGTTGGALSIGLGLLFRRTSTVAFALLAAICIVTTAAWLSGEFATPALLNISILACASLVWMVVTELDSGLSSALKAEDGFIVSAGLEVIARAMQVALTILLIPTHGSAMAAIAIAIGVVVSKAIAKTILLRRARIELSGAGGQGRSYAAQVVASMTSNGRWICLGVLSGLALNAFDRWLVGAQFGVAVLSAYAICTQIAQLPHSVAAAAAQVLTPWAAVRTNRLSDPVECGHMLRVFGLATIAAAVPSGVLFLSLEPVLERWISPGFAAEHLSMARGLTVVFALVTLNVPAYFMALGLGRSRVVTMINSLAAVVFAIACTAFYLPLPMFIAAKGVCFGLTLMMNVYVYLLLRGKVSTTPSM